MCVAIYKPAKVSIAKKVLEACAEQNKDGCGMAYISQETGEIVVFKTMHFKDFYPVYKEAFRDNKESPFLIHFRIATKGKVNEDNCHPFVIDENHVFIHNGTITPVPVDPKGEVSDTRIFNEMILKKLPNGWVVNDGIKAMVEEFIGKSKLAVLNRNGDVHLYNEKDGSWKEGVWFSNTRHEWRLKPSTYGTNDWKRVEHEDGSWTWNGIRRRWNGKLLEALCPRTDKWRPFNSVSQEFLDTGESYQDALDAKKTKEKSDDRWYKCEYCSDLLRRKDVALYSMDGYSSCMCESCYRQFVRWGCTIFTVIGKDPEPIRRVYAS